MMSKRKTAGVLQCSRRHFLAGVAALAGAHVASRAHAGSPFAVDKMPVAGPSERLAAVEAALEGQRKALGIPGAALAIVKDDRVIFLKGFGVRELESNRPVTPDTLFSIGSDTKAFTAAAAVMSQEAGLLSLDDSPKKYLSYFRLHDPEADAQITLRDLLVHNSGVMRTDFSWVSGVLTREEAIRVAGLAKPTAKFRQAFQYQNAMYMAAGEAVGRAHSATWEQVIAEKIFRPLGMSASTTSLEAMRQTVDFAAGHERVESGLKPAPIVDRSNVGGCGAITSSARDMARWLRLLLGRGALGETRLFSEQGYEAMTTQHISTGAGGYGLGFFLGARDGIKTVFHGGTIEGFNSHLFFVPEHRLGFVLLTNVATSTLPKVVEDAVWTSLVKPAEAAPAAPASAADPGPRGEVGRYVTTGFYLDVVHKDDRLHAVVPGHGEVPMTAVGPRRYRWDPPAPAGFFLTFRPSAERAGENAGYLEQPNGQGNVELIKVAVGSAGISPGMRELFGQYELDGAKVMVEARGDFALVTVPQQPPYHLAEKATDEYVLVELGDTYRIQARRDASGAVAAVVFKQPNGEFLARRVGGAAPASVDITVDELMAKAIAAAGGEAALRKSRSMLLISDYELENLGLTAQASSTSLAPDAKTSTMTFFGLGKDIGKIRIDCAGAEARMEWTLLAGAQAGSCPSGFDYASLVGWKTWWQSVTVESKAKLGDEEVYVVVKVAKGGRRERDHISAKSFLVLRRENDNVGADPVLHLGSETFSEYRAVGGIMIPMRCEATHAGLGRIIGRVREVKFLDLQKVT